MSDSILNGKTIGQDMNKENRWCWASHSRQKSEKKVQFVEMPQFASKAKINVFRNVFE